MTEQCGSTSICATYSTGLRVDIHHMATGRTLTLSKPRSSSYRPWSLSSKRRKAPLKSLRAGHRADFERERERSDKLMANTLSLAATAMSARLKRLRSVLQRLTLRFRVSIGGDHDDRDVWP